MSGARRETPLLDGAQRATLTGRGRQLLALGSPSECLQLGGPPGDLFLEFLILAREVRLVRRKQIVLARTDMSSGGPRTSSRPTMLFQTGSTPEARVCNEFHRLDHSSTPWCTPFERSDQSSGSRLGAYGLKIFLRIILGEHSERWERSRLCRQQASDARLSLALPERSLLDEVAQPGSRGSRSHPGG